MKFEPHPYQRYAIKRAVNDRAVGLMLDMGLGKTAIMLSAVKELIYDRLECRKALIIAPKKVAEATWQAEARKWDDLKDLRFSTILGTAKQRLAAIDADADVYVVSRDNVVWLTDQYTAAAGRRWDFDILVVDESSSFKNPAAKRFKALKGVLPRITHTVILTGTPAPNGIEDLWAQIYLLDRGERLGRNISAFRARWFDHNPWAHTYTPKDGAFDEVRKLISDICISMSAKDYLQLPEMIVDDIPVALDKKASEAYTEMEKSMVLELDGEEITAFNAAALTGKLLQLCSGSVYDENGESRWIHACKIEALSELIEQLHGEHALIFYGFRHEVPRIRAMIDKDFPRLRVREMESAEDMDAWNRGEVDLLLAHPASCAYGLNLQQGGRHVIWYTLSWSLELYQQANARLHRQGQTGSVIVHRLLTQDGMDEAVARALSGKDGLQSALLQSIKARTEMYQRSEFK